ncbi:MAG: class I SAM-dependent methyltransferase [Alphaproteobacteria bacterium]|uniref:class I SAM-dependent methyltransferase n=1 Tax=Rhizobium sp. 'Codium 1' TaxID=2940484 RepID=UPI001E4B3A63|nr:methyltransferase domain-containing protein [Rhizobium sp. 'Codium 1']MBU2326001.1 class I SAM-dependent methyltransferase [Alphaproteobacteria bacterium]MCC8931506.1 class I SAM-dependent methyltransferase [Rhizobium sp. 'Codium 1']
MQAVSTISNRDLRDEIKAYWSLRAETFDSQPGHEIFSEDERAAWHALLRKHLGPGEGRAALDLACGTAVISHLLDDVGFKVTGLDWAEPMLERARAKAKARGRQIRFLMGDAERTMESDDTYDVITNRHLVWTLVDPLACFREWHRVLKAGGKVLIVDGDFVNTSILTRLVKRLTALAGRLGLAGDAMHGAPNSEMAATHSSILSRVHFSNGAHADAVAALLREAGFSKVTIDRDMSAIHRAQRENFSFFKGLERATQHRYAICAEK